MEKPALLPVGAEGSGVPRGGADGREDLAGRNGGVWKGRGPHRSLCGRRPPRRAPGSPVGGLHFVADALCILHACLRARGEEAAGRRITRRRSNPILSRTAAAAGWGPGGGFRARSLSTPAPLRCLFLRCPSLSWGGLASPSDRGCETGCDVSEVPLPVPLRLPGAREAVPAPCPVVKK